MPDRGPPPPRERAFLAFGGNIGDSRVILGRAVAALCDGAAIRLVARSSDYVTPPWGMTYQPPFVNLCIEIETTLAPPALLERTQSVELQFGRDRQVEKRWGPRTCDIDILAYDDLTLNVPELTLPHPRLFERAFVLVPLAEIAPDAMIGGRRIADAAAPLDTADIHKLPPA
jgi:2-amino-4-hydroxy-6-hydroxymethyldihydropteridine diphosphokinase